MKTYSFYDSTTGVFTGRTLSTNVADLTQHPDWVRRNTPEGCAARAGHFDHLSERVDVVTGDVIAYQPPPPSPDHEWSAETRRWVLNAAASARVQTRAAAAARIAALESAQLPIIRRAVLGDAAALSELRVLDAEIRDLSQAAARAMTSSPSADTTQTN